MSDTNPRSTGEGGHKTTGGSPQSHVRVATEGHEPSTGNGWIVLLFLTIPVAALLVAARIAPDSNTGFRDAAAVLTFVTAAAVGIERALEVLWSLVGNSTLGQWWPLKQVSARMKAYEEYVDDLLTEPLQGAIQVLEEAKEAAQVGSEAAKAAATTIEDLRQAQNQLRQRVTNARSLAPGSARFQLMTEIADDCAKQVAAVLDWAKTAGSSQVPMLRERLDDTQEACKQLTDIISSFQDNPARRLASLSLGIAAGAVIAGLFALNMFVAVLGESDADVVVDLSGTVGIVLTGVVIGLGSNPTHEVIKALERRKQNRPEITVPDRPASPVTATEAMASAAAVTGARPLLEDTPGARALMAAAVPNWTPPEGRTPDQDLAPALGPLPQRMRQIRSSG